MWCNQCGTKIEENSTSGFCPCCGASINISQPATDNSSQEVYYSQSSQMTLNGVPVNAQQSDTQDSFTCKYLNKDGMMYKSDFVKHPNNTFYRKQFMAEGIALYIMAGLVGALGFATGAGVYALFDVAIIVGMGCGIHLGKSRVCAIILSVYTLISVIIATIQRGRLSGWLMIYIAANAIYLTFKFDKVYKEYLKTGRVEIAGPPQKVKKK